MGERELDSMSVTIKDVARQAGVSIATVSRYMNCPEKVSEDKSRKIAQVIEEMDYTPDSVAKALITRHSSTIGLIISDINNAFYPPVIRAIADEVEKAGYITYLCNTDQSITREKKFLKECISQRVAGIIFIGTRPLKPEKNRHLLQMSGRVPLLVLFEDMFGGKLPAIANPEDTGSYMAVRYLQELGHKKIGFLTSGADYTTYHKKQYGYMKAMEEAGLPVPEGYIATEGQYEEDGRKGMKRLMQLAEPPTAVHAANDQLAAGAVFGAMELGLSVPGDVSVIGFANNPLAETVYPGITTVDQCAAEIGQMAGKQMVQMIEEGKVSGGICWVEPKLKLRNSCASPRKNAEDQ